MVVRDYHDQEAALRNEPTARVGGDGPWRPFQAIFRAPQFLRRNFFQAKIIKAFRQR